MSAQPHAQAAPGIVYPYLVTRTYLCGHPPEHLQVDSQHRPNQPPVILHTYISPPKPAATSRPYKQILERCSQCAQAYRAHKRPQSRQEPAWSLFPHQREAHRDVSHAKENHAAKPHAAIPYRSRTNKHVSGPRSSYNIVVDVHESLIEPDTPPLPLSPKLQRRSATVPIESHSPWAPGEGIANPSFKERRHSGVTSLSLGDQPRNTTFLSHPSRSQSTRIRGGPPLPVLKSRRDMLKEKVAVSSGSISPHTPRKPRTSQESWRNGGIWGSDESGITEAEQCSLPESLQVSQHSPRAGIRRQATIGHSSCESAGPNPYHYSPWSPAEQPAAHQKLRRANTTRRHRSSDTSPHRRIFEELHEYQERDISRGGSNGTSHSPRTNAEHCAPPSIRSHQMSPPHGAVRRNENSSNHGHLDVRPPIRCDNRLLQPGIREEDSDSDASSIGRW